MREINEFRLKIFLIIFLSLAFIIIENLIISINIYPIAQHYSYLKSIGEKYLLSNSQFLEDSFFCNQEQLLIHTTIHKDEDELYSCQNKLDQNCYLASSFISIFSETNILNKTLLKGKMPNNENQIAINSDLAKRLNLNIGDSVLLKSSFIREVEICGITKNSFGIEKYSRDITSAYYCITFEDLSYLQNFRGKDYCFVNKITDGLEAIDIENQINEFELELVGLLIILFILNFFLLTFVYNFYSKILKLPSYYKHLHYLGFSLSEIKKRYIYDLILFVVTNILLILISGIFLFWFPMMATQLITCIIFGIIALLIKGIRIKWMY